MPFFEEGALPSVRIPNTFGVRVQNTLLYVSRTPRFAVTSPSMLWALITLRVFSTGLLLRFFSRQHSHLIPCCREGCLIAEEEEAKAGAVRDLVERLDHVQ